MWTPLNDSLWNNIRSVFKNNTKLNLTLIFSRKLVGLCVTVVDFGLFSGNGGGGCKSRSFVSKLVTRSLQGCCPFLFSTSFPMTEICFIPVPKDPNKVKKSGVRMDHGPSAIDSESIKPLSVLHSGLKREW